MADKAAAPAAENKRHWLTSPLPTLAPRGSPKPPPMFETIGGPSCAEKAFNFASAIPPGIKAASEDRSRFLKSAELVSMLQVQISHPTPWEKRNPGILRGVPKNYQSTSPGRPVAEISVQRFAAY
ncbi:hypothetical protein EVAR_69080_1 [Eumeta japonica]|uniref:Uncharacterized protein n=1 Tax=Eumeta variegata TaxID=151549 RepID=A0A4C1ZFH8_EUMVA|nr:hypothetical protein EVAR_69080_1 [Eumeta japonica]